MLEKYSKLPATIVASSVNAAGATTSGTLDMTNAYEVLATGKITNGATGPTVACTCRWYTSHDGVAWKLHSIWTAGVVANAIFEPPPQHFSLATMHVKAEFSGNTGQGVTVEALAQMCTAV